MQISAQKVVSIDYTLTNDQGEVIDTSEGRGPLAYIQGMGNIIPGLEKALEGKSKGDTLNVAVPPEEGYGEHNDALTQEVPREAFEGADNIQVGMQFQAQTEAGPQVVTIAAVNEQTVVVDGNHPLAGQTLNFAVEVVDIRDASADEIAHGHVHE